MPKKEITQFSLEELLQTEFYSASKDTRSISRTPAAVFVIDQEDIRRSTAQNVPELLRMVPGLDVARNSASGWAITSRGFNDTLANKLLVLIDGRSVYTPLFAGVYWDVQDLLLEDIDRIEVIRGPGGSLWGSNAVNGVINIITKHSSETEKVLVKGGAGNERQDGAVRVGGAVGQDFTYRTYAKYFNQDHSFQAHDAWYQWRTGFRSDWQANEDNSVTFQGDYYNGDERLRGFGNFGEAPFQRVIQEDQEVGGGNLLAKWSHLFSETSDGTLQMYYDQTKRDQTQISEDRYTWDIEWDHRFLRGDRHEWVYGAGYRLSADNTKGSFNTSFTPDDRILHLFQSFVQDTYAIVPDKLWLTTGLKIEHNSYTAFEFQPTARLLWNPYENHTLWTAYSRAVRVPSRVERDITLQAWATPGSVLVPIHADSTTESEALNAYEAGYRVQIHPRAAIDIATFYNHYNALRNSRFGTPFAENGLTHIPVFFDDQARAKTYGAELYVETHFWDSWQLNTGYTLLQILLDPHQDAVNAISQAEGKSPNHQIFVQSRLDLPLNTEFDTELRYVDTLSALDVPSYWEMNLRLGWKITKNLEVSLIGQNLFHNYHREFTATGPGIQRAVYGQAVLKFD